MRSEPPLSVTIALLLILILALLLLGAVGYWRLETMFRASYGQTQEALAPLRQRIERLDERTAIALQDLQELRQEQEAIKARIETLEAERAQIADCRSEVSNLQSELLNLQSEISDLDKRLDDLPAIRKDLITIKRELEATYNASEGKLAPEPTSLGVPLYKQTHSLSCEATSASMVAAFFGVHLSEEEAIKALPRHENPNLGFRGDIDGSPGGLEDYGVHAAPIQKLLATYGLRATYIKGGLEGIRSALKAGHPVIAWITYHLWKESPVEVELTTGERVKMVPYEHTVVLEGYTTEGLWALDPYDGERQLLPWADFERSWGYLDQMALEIAGP